MKSHQKNPQGLYWQTLKSLLNILGREEPTSQSNIENASKSFFKVNFRWMPRAGPTLFFTLGEKEIGMAFFCHRQEDRSLKIHGHTSFLCARCTGILTGVILSGLLMLFTSISLPIEAIGLLCLPLLIDGFTQLSGKRESNNTLRFVTGVLFAFGMLLFVLKR